MKIKNPLHCPFSPPTPLSSSCWLFCPLGAQQKFSLLPTRGQGYLHTAPPGDEEDWDDFPKLKLRLFPKIGKSIKTEKFRNQNVNLWPSVQNRFTICRGACRTYLCENMFIWSSKWQSKKVFDGESIQFAVEWLYIQMDAKSIDSLRHIHNYCQTCTCLIGRCYLPDCFCFLPFFLLITFIVNLRGEALASGSHYYLMDSTLHTVWTFCTQKSATALVNAVITSSKYRN